MNNNENIDHMIKEYLGIKLIPTIFSDLMVEQFDGKRFKRQDAITTICSVFASKGGSLVGVDKVSVFKKATAYLKYKGLNNVTYGIWELNYHKQVTGFIKTKSNKNIIFDIEIGRGKQSVYVYYFDVYRKLALNENKTTWPCKIGMTVNDSNDRIIGQAKTVFPERPVFALLIHTDDAVKCEKAIYAVLEFWGKSSLVLEMNGTLQIVAKY